MQLTIERDSVMERINAIPIVSTLGMKIDMLTKDVVQVRVPREKKYDGVFETFHGGLLMTIADTIACFLIIKRAGAEVKIATTDMNIRFLAPCTTDVTAEARFVKSGRTLNTIEVDLYDANSVRVAVAHVCYMRLDGLENNNGSGSRPVDRKGAAE